MRIPIVNEKDEIIEHKDRDAKKPEDIIRITAIWITNENGDILLAQRALTKKDNPGKWGPSVAGTVEEGETYENNAYKEMREEIGVENVPLKLSEKMFLDSPTGKKFCQMYEAVLSKDAKFIIEEKEVAQIKWFTRVELKKFYNEKPEEFVKSFGQLQFRFS